MLPKIRWSTSTWNQPFASPAVGWNLLSAKWWQCWAGIDLARTLCWHPAASSCYFFGGLCHLGPTATGGTQLPVAALPLLQCSTMCHCYLGHQCSCYLGCQCHCYNVVQCATTTWALGATTATWAASATGGTHWWQPVACWGIGWETRPC